MAKVVPSTIAGAYASTAELNANFALLAAEFENALSLDGTVPNAMGADFDMNNQDILNAKDIFADSITVDDLIFTGIQLGTASEVAIADAGAYYVGTDVEEALQEVGASFAALDEFTDFYAGFITTGLHTVYASDLDLLLLNGRYSFIASGVTNEPADLISTEYGILTVMARDADDVIQTIHGQTGTAVGKTWVRSNESGTWGAWQFSGGGAVHPANAFFLMGA